MPGRSNSANGFTLIELMIVLLLIGIFGGLIMTEMRGSYEDALLRSTARKLISAAVLANSKAVTLNRTHFVRLDPVSGRFEVRMQRTGRAEGSADENVDSESGQLDSRIHVELRDSSGEVEANDDGTNSLGEPTAQPEQITFYPDGTAEPREIILRDRLGVGLILRVHQVTGKIEIDESEAAK